MRNALRPALVLFLLLTLLTGVVYPLAVTGIAKLVFPQQAGGSLIVKEGQPVGSELIGQSFTNPKYFWGRPSATAPMANSAAASGGSNLGPLNPALVDTVTGRIVALRAADPESTTAVPVDLVTASGSGLDPEIGVAAANYQATRVARVRSLPLDQVQQLVEAHTTLPWLGVVGEPRVHVLRLNLALDAAEGQASSPITNHPSPK